ncbi:MAG: DUF3791 domain-containing protein [Bacteroidales bacterium]|nr:DUF3791 domain-containing protein [Bacteroidales bacterium]
MSNTNTTKNTVEFIAVVVSSFAQKFGMSNADAYKYMKQFGAMESIIRNYEGLHTQSIDDAVDFAVDVCRNHGGNLQ